MARTKKVAASPEAVVGADVKKYVQLTPANELFWDAQNNCPFKDRFVDGKLSTSDPRLIEILKLGGYQEESV